MAKKILVLVALITVIGWMGAEEEKALKQTEAINRTVYENAR